MSLLTQEEMEKLDRNLKNKSAFMLISLFENVINTHYSRLRSEISEDQVAVTRVLRDLEREAIAKLKKELSQILLIILVPAFLFTACTNQSGEKGEQGAQGVAGKAGSELSIQSDTKCDEYDSSLDLGLSYEITTLSSGDIVVTCSIYNAQSQSTATYYWKKGQNTNFCQVTSDLDTPTFGFWAFNYNIGGNGAYNAEYNDPTSSEDGRIRAFSTCTTH